MKNFDSRTYSINDFLEWKRNSQLELNPRFQRRDVWTDHARSYLMDTIVRGKPIPKIFIRQKINPTTRASVREVVDGQQRLRTILSYLEDGFPISPQHHKTYGGFYFSQLADVDPEIQTNILNYELSVDLLVNMPDAEVLDVFSRLNSYAVILNDQEKVNATHFGPFKVLADKLGHHYNEFWIKNRILTPQRILRMEEVTLTADLLVAMLEGIRAKKQLKSFYSSYESKFPWNVTEIEQQFHSTMQAIELVFGDNLPQSEFHRIHLFYTLFTAFYHAVNGLPGVSLPRPTIDEQSAARLMSLLGRIDEAFAIKEEGGDLDKARDRFVEDSRRATTDAPVRTRRTEFVIELMTSA